MNIARFVLQITIILLVLISTCNANEFYDFLAPEDWEFECKNSENSHFCSIFTQGTDNSLLMFSTLSHEKNQNDAKQIVEDAIEFYSQKAKERLGKSEIIKSEQQPIEGIEFSGGSVIMFHADNFVLALFSLSNGSTVLSGQFVGATEQWLIAVNILKTLKIKG